MKLDKLASDDQRFVLLDLDKPRLLAQLIGLKEDKVHYEVDLEQLIALASKQLSAKVSGLVLGPKVGFAAINQKQSPAGLLLSLNNNLLAHDPLNLPNFLPDWGVEHIRNNYGVAKLDLFYHPAESKANEKKKLLAEIYDYAQYEGIDLVLELHVLFDDKNKQALDAFLEAQLMAVREFQDMTDLFILQFPQTALACATVTAEIDVPWLMNDHGGDYLQLKANLRTALEGGARGMLLGQSIWSGLPKIGRAGLNKNFLNLWEKFLVTEARDRVIELGRIINEFNLLEES